MASLPLLLMAKEPFIQPKFVGPRFDENTLPLSAAKDLVAYEELVVELAKHLYLTKNRDRQRVPKGFADGFHLHLENRLGIGVRFLGLNVSSEHLVFDGLKVRLILPSASFHQQIE